MERFENEHFAQARKRMIRTQLIPRGIRDKRVLAAMGKIPREMFVGYLKEEAYEDRPLPIGEEQTISQPYMVAYMSQCLGLRGNEKVLEIGTGSGYQAAVLAELSREVYTVERIGSLLKRAQKTLSKLGYTNIYFKVADGTAGWEEKGPFDGIMVTAAAPKIPKPLLDQLAEGGRLLIPVGDEYGQELIRVTKQGGRLIEQDLLGVRFVPLKGAHGWDGEKGGV